MSRELGQASRAISTRPKRIYEIVANLLWLRSLETMRRFHPYIVSKFTENHNRS